MSNDPLQPYDHRPILTLEEAADLARTNVSTIRYWVSIGKLRGSIRVGKRRLVPRRALAEALGVDLKDLVLSKDEAPPLPIRSGDKVFSMEEVRELLDYSSRGATVEEKISALAAQVNHLGIRP